MNGKEVIAQVGQPVPLILLAFLVKQLVLCQIGDVNFGAGMPDTSRTYLMSRLIGKGAEFAERQDKRFTSRRYTAMLTSGLQWSQSALSAPFHAAATINLSVCDIGTERQRNYQAHVSLTELNRSEHSPLFFRKISQAVDIQLHDAGKCTAVTFRTGALRRCVSSCVLAEQCKFKPSNPKQPAA